MAVGSEWAGRLIPVEHLPRYLGLDIPTCLTIANQVTYYELSYQLPLDKTRL